MWPFRRTPLLDAETARWHLDNFAWLVRHFPGCGRPADGRLIVPGEGFFVTDGEMGHALAERLFDQVLRYAGVPRAGLLLAENGRLPPDDPASGAVQAVRGNHALGTYSWGIQGAEKGAVHRPQITYAPKLLANPQSFIAAMAHELAHHLLLAGTAEKPPNDADEDENLTDLVAVYLGFGVFLANSAFTIETYSNGWGYTRQGYLPEHELVFATALHLAVRQLDPAPAMCYLKPHLGEILGKAMKDLKSFGREVAAMRAADAA